MQVGKQMQVAEGKWCSAWVNIGPCTLAPSLVRARVSPFLLISANGITRGKDAWLAAASRRWVGGGVSVVVRCLARLLASSLARLFARSPLRSLASSLVCVCVRVVLSDEQVLSRLNAARESL